MKTIILYLIAINVVTFLVYGLDKWKAKRDAWRISESTLLLLAAAGGSVGALLGMQIFRHKTKHVKFTVGVPVILLVQVALAIWWLVR
jgi:uncharacterized membrane protein YsdA (DUF1294 family)